MLIIIAYVNIKFYAPEHSDIEYRIYLVHKTPYSSYENSIISWYRIIAQFSNVLYELTSCWKIYNERDIDSIESNMGINTK